MKQTVPLKSQCPVAECFKISLYILNIIKYKTMKQTVPLKRQCSVAVGFGLPSPAVQLDVLAGVQSCFEQVVAQPPVP